MVKINLVNKSTVQIQPSAPLLSDSGEILLTRDELLKQAGMRVFLMLLFPLSLYLYEDYILIPDMNRAINAKSKELAELRAYNQKREPSVSEIKKYGDEKIKIERKIEILNKIARERGRELALHKFFQRAVPDKTWLSEYVYDQGKDKITLKGSSFFSSDIPKLRQEIQSDVMFKSVEVGAQKEGKFQGQSTEDFEMVINLEKINEPTP